MERGGYTQRSFELGSTERYENITGNNNHQNPNHTLKITTGLYNGLQINDPNLISSYCGMFKLGKPDGLGIEINKFD